MGGKPSYTPATGYFGSDAVSYVARAAEGGATHTAHVAITAQGQLSVSGAIAAGPIAKANVQSTPGSTDFSTTADASGSDVLEITAAKPTDFVTVTAGGIGT